MTRAAVKMKEPGDRSQAHFFGLFEEIDFLKTRIYLYIPVLKKVTSDVKLVYTCIQGFSSLLLLLVRRNLYILVYTGFRKARELKEKTLLTSIYKFSGGTYGP